MKRIRFLAALLAVFAGTFLAAKDLSYSAIQKPMKQVNVALWQRPGGRVDLYMKQAIVWTRDKTRVVVIGDQYSAAAMQVLRLHVLKADVCTMPGVTLHFHRPFFSFGKLRVGDPQWHDEFEDLFGKENTKIIGKVTVEDWSVRDPSEFGIPAC